MQTFGSYLKALRKQRGLTLEKLAKKSSVRKGYLSGVETGKLNPPSAKVLRALARALDTDQKEMLVRAYIEKVPVEVRPQLEAFLTASDATV